MNPYVLRIAILSPEIWEGNYLMQLSDDLFDQVYNPHLLAEIEQEFGPFAQQHVDLHINTEAMRTMVGQMRRSGNPRRAEVVLVVPDDLGDIWLHTKHFYPPDTYRLMTGGIDFGEKPAAAALREAKEETGFALTLTRCLGVITCRFFDGAEPMPFASYLFLTTPGQGQPQPVDESENIAGFVAVSPAELKKTARQLESLAGRFTDWGRFRAISHDLAAAALTK
jgi:8-oxo-dGTP pyrophosphatase MutT (NUDIX family)